MTNPFVALTEQLRERRGRRLSQITHALQSVRPDWRLWPNWSATPNLAWAAATHTLYETHEAARGRDRARFSHALELWDTSLQRCSVDVGFGPTFAVSGQHCIRRDDEHFGSPLFVLSAEAVRQGLTTTAAGPDLKAAVRAINDAGAAKWLVAGPGVIVVLNRRARLEPVTSYSVLALQSTVFTEWTDCVIRLGESLLHEATHCWLNECLQACGEELANTPKWYSPWTDSMRPAYGIVHAALAFSVLCQYWRATLPTLPADGFEHRYCARRLGVECENLTRLRFDFYAALGHVKSPELRHVVLSSFNDAVAA